jgi:hypothetical protein
MRQFKERRWTLGNTLLRRKYWHAVDGKSLPSRGDNVAKCATALARARTLIPRCNRGIRLFARTFDIKQIGL